MTACCLSTLRDWGHTDCPQLASPARGAGTIIEQSAVPAGASLTQRPPRAICPRLLEGHGSAAQPAVSTSPRTAWGSPGERPGESISHGDGSPNRNFLRFLASLREKPSHRPQRPLQTFLPCPGLASPLARPLCGFWRCHAPSWTWALRRGPPPSLCPPSLTPLPTPSIFWSLDLAQCPPHLPPEPGPPPPVPRPSLHSRPGL
ncbi:basic proline-rich protein-like [Zalophus californianus]|uniref:Basic proline-rich protein-like n=1 Tax=Zalophus californianus TaxID=9704 RepID=A0A6J2B437_ZALCA|nr:basic proline-rich protein-like [Zalophus californianus]